MNAIDPNPKVIEARYRILLILWFAMGASVLLFLVVLRLSAVAGGQQPQVESGAQQLRNCAGCDLVSIQTANAR